MPLCKEKDCSRKGCWTETNTAGELVFCFRVRHDGAYHVQKYTLGEIAEALNEQVKAASCGVAAL